MALVTTATGVINRIIFVGLILLNHNREDVGLGDNVNEATCPTTAGPVCYVIQRAKSLFELCLRKKQPLSVPV